MIKTTVLCDRCKKKIQYLDTRKLFIFSQDYERVDLCNECYKEFSDWYYQNCERGGKE